MLISRRAFLHTGTAAAAVLAAAPASAAEEARRRFRIIRDGSDIGEHLTIVRRAGDEVQVEVAVDIRVKLLGITAYRYEMESKEVWKAGRLVSLDSRTDDDGDKETARVRAEGDRLISEGTWNGEAPGRSATTTYWAPEFRGRPTWISTQTGKPLGVTVARAGTESIPGLSGSLDCTRWKAAGDLELELYYDARDEWMGNAFDAGGVRARFEAVDETGPLAPLWAIA